LTKKLNWSLLIFAFNEEGSIGKVIEKAIQFSDENKDGSTEIIILEDGSTDNTKAIIEKYVSLHPEIRTCIHETNQGIGMALKSVYALAKNEYVCAIPADNQFDIDLLKVVQPFSDDYFFSFYRRNPYENHFRNFLHYFNRALNRMLFGFKLKDVNWVKVYKLKQLKSISTELSSSLIESEICIKITLNGINAIEHYSPYLPRESGSSKGGSFQTVKKAIREIFILFSVIRRFKRQQKDL
jgi:glycosyltransferase involved in cell wall biosynthesis